MRRAENAILGEELSLNGHSEPCRREPLPAAAFVVAGSPAGRLASLRCEVAFVDYLHAERAAGLVRIIDTDHGEEQVIGDADRQEQVGVDAGVGELAERG